MPIKPKRNPTRYYLLLVLFLAFLFFTNDFGLIDTQKTAIVTAVGIDREGDEIILTSQIAIPQSSSQGKSTEAVQLVSRGKTVSQAFEDINAKTGWYPKLVFCKLLILGKKVAEQNVFDVLDFFLLDEYLTDDCLVAVCDGFAKDILDVSTLVDPTSSLAIEKVLSSHAERVGTVHPTNLKDFAVGYFGEDTSGLLPVLKKEKQKESIPSQSNSSLNEKTDNISQESNSAQQEGGNSQSDGNQENQSTQKQELTKTVFSAKETALFVRGVWMETLTPEEAFAVNAVIGKLRLASYSVAVNDATCTLTIKHNTPKIDLSVGEKGNGSVKIHLTMTAGIADYSKAVDLNKLSDVGDVPDGMFAAAEKKLTGELTSAYEKARAVGCDVFSIKERLSKYKNRNYQTKKEEFFNHNTLSIHVRFEGVR